MGRITLPEFSSENIATLNDSIRLHYLNHTFPTPEANLACDEALLSLCEEGTCDEVLRFWEPEDYFVVLGSSNTVAKEVHNELCEADGVPIFRRHWLRSMAHHHYPGLPRPSNIIESFNKRVTASQATGIIA